MSPMSPTEAFLVVGGIVLAALGIGAAVALLLLAGRHRRLTFPRRPDRRGGIAEHQEHYWQ